jgi:Nif-specific regulatory protein
MTVVSTPLEDTDLDAPLLTLSRIARVLGRGDRDAPDRLTSVLETLVSQLGLAGAVLTVAREGAQQLHAFFPPSLDQALLDQLATQASSPVQHVIAGYDAAADAGAGNPELTRDYLRVLIERGTKPLGSLTAVVDQGVQLEKLLRILQVVARMLVSELELLVSRHAGAIPDSIRPSNIIGNSKVMRKVYRSIDQVAGSTTTVLIQGESGTGKELVATAIHQRSKRASGPLVKVNCAALSESLLESELFGHEKGAFTGATQRRLGRLEEADGGTLFLDEIGDFPPSVQVTLLRVLQEKEFQRVGSNETQRANVRIIAATNRDLRIAVANGDFREDLYYRVNVFPIMLPPLRERRGDILQLADFFAKKYASANERLAPRISTPAIEMLLAYHWPGNVRELENCIEHAMLLSRDGVIYGHSLPPSLQVPDDTETYGTLKDRIAQLERDMICDALKRTRGNLSAAARELGLTARIVRYKLQKLDIDYQRIFKNHSSRS